MERKVREIALLKRYLRKSPALAILSSPAEVIDMKFELAATMRAERAMESWAVTETAHPTVARWNSGSFEFSFGYQRADLNVCGPPIYLQLGGAIPAEHILYTGAGMSAIASMLTAALTLRESLDVSLPRGAYSETRELCARFGNRVRVQARRPRRSAPCDEARTCVLWIDSCVPCEFDDFTTLPSQAFDLVVFDTTCFSLGSRRIVRVVEWAQRARLPIALVRSHAKLDCLGIEYGRLGSIGYLWDKHDAGQAWMRDLVGESREVIRLFGAAALLSHFPPFAGDPAYYDCTVRRTAAILRNTRRAARQLARACGTGAIRTFQHNLYLTLVPAVPREVAAVWRIAREMCTALARQNLPVKHAGSFAFDFTALDVFVDPLSRHPVLRIAPGDLPPETMDRIVDAIAAYWAPLELATGGDTALRRRSPPRLKDETVAAPPPTLLVHSASSNAMAGKGQSDRMPTIVGKSSPN